jgi:hypothetical protein
VRLLYDDVYLGSKVCECIRKETLMLMLMIDDDAFNDKRDTEMIYSTPG